MEREVFEPYVSFELGKDNKLYVSIGGGEYECCMEQEFTYEQAVEMLDCLKAVLGKE